MNKKSWLIVGLSLAMAASIGVGISACGGKEPDTPPTPTEHTHTYDAWDYDETQHWKYCDEHGEDKSNIDETTRENHIFTNGTCECGMKEADVTPDEGRDTRVFYVVGSGAGDLSKCSFTELKSNFMLTKQPKKDENGYTVYATAALTLYAGDTMKIVQDLDWDEGLGYFGVSNIKNNDGSLVDGGGPGNITPAVGKDGKYIFIVRTKPDISFAQCTLEVKFVEPVEPLKKTEEIYIVGSLMHCTTQWPSGGSVAGCQKLDYDEATGEWSIILRLGRGPGVVNGDEFKLYNAVNGKYYPDGTGNNVTVGGSTDGEISPTSKASGDYKISWKTGDFDVTMTKLEHTHVFDRMAYDDNQHWTECWLDNTVKPDSVRENHVYANDQDATCDVCYYRRHVHNYKQMYDETEHWMECPTDHAIDPAHPKTAHTVDPDTHKCECGYEEHVHSYTEWRYDATQHWKACADDEEIDPAGKQGHDFKGGNTCECGYTRTECAHESYTFEYTPENMPAFVAEGGTLVATCDSCGNQVNIPYDAGMSVTVSRNIKTKGMITEGKTYMTSAQSLYFKSEMAKAGTYTMNIQMVAAVKGFQLGADDGLQILDLSRDSATYQLNVSGLYNSGEFNNNHSMIAFKDKCEINQMSVTITLTEEDLAEGSIFAFFGFSIFSTSSNYGILVTYSYSAPAPAALVAPQEVALLPGKKN